MVTQPVNQLRMLLADSHHRPVHAGQTVRSVPVRLGRTVWSGYAAIVLAGGNNWRKLGLRGGSGEQFWHPRRPSLAKNSSDVCQAGARPRRACAAMNPMPAHLLAPHRTNQPAPNLADEGMRAWN